MTLNFKFVYFFSESYQFESRLCYRICLTIFTLSSFTWLTFEHWTSELWKRLMDRFTSRCRRLFWRNYLRKYLSKIRSKSNINSTCYPPFAFLVFGAGIYRSASSLHCQNSSWTYRWWDNQDNSTLHIWDIWEQHQREIRNLSDAFFKHGYINYFCHWNLLELL